MLKFFVCNNKTKLENIHERRKRINEIISDLQKDEELFEPKKNLLEE